MAATAGSAAVKTENSDSSADETKSSEAEIRTSVLSDAFDGEDIFTKEPFDRLMSTNQYTVRKMASQALIDVALMMANIAQLRTLVSADGIYYKSFLFSLVVSSLISQVVFGVLIFVIWVRESEAQHREAFERDVAIRLYKKEDGKMDESVSKRLSILRLRNHFQKEVVTTRLNHVTMILVFFITITNMLITGFGFQQTVTSQIRNGTECVQRS